MKEKTKKKLIYIRYILPPVLMVLMLAMLLIPAYLFVISGEVNEENVSALGLMKNSYEEARRALFGGEEQSAANLLFSKILLGLIVILPLLFTVGLAAAVYSAIVAIRYFTSDDEERAEQSRTLFVTFFPNRICLFIAEALTLSLCLFPYLMSPLYDWIFGTNVVLLLRAPDGLIFGGIALAAILVLSAVCAPMEREFEADIFKKRKDFEVREYEDEDAEEVYEPMFGSASEDSEAEDRSDRNARIRELLSKNKKD